MKITDAHYAILIEDILSGETILGGIYSDLLKASDNLTCYDDYKKIYIEEIGG